MWQSRGAVVSLLWVSECVGGWVSGWVGGWVSEWVGEWVGGWVSGWVSEWVSEFECCWRCRLLSTLVALCSLSASSLQELCIMTHSSWLQQQRLMRVRWRRRWMLTHHCSLPLVLLSYSSVNWTLHELLYLVFVSHQESVPTVLKGLRQTMSVWV